MKQYIELACPSCQRTLRIRTEYVGHRISCRFCKHLFVPQTPSAQQAAVTEPGSNPELELLKKRIAALEEEGRQQRLQLEARSGTLATTQELLQEMRSEWVRSQDQLHKLQQEHTELDRQVQTHQGTRAELENRLEMLRAECAQSAGQIQALQEQLATNEQARQEMERQRQEERATAAQELASVRAAHDCVLAEHQTGLNEAERLRGHIGELEKALQEARALAELNQSKLEQTRIQLEADKQELRTTWDDQYQASVLETERHIQAEQAKSSAERQHLQEQISGLQAQLAKTEEAATQEADDLRREVAGVIKVRDQLQAKLESDFAAHRAASEAAATTIAALNNALDSAREQEAASLQQKQQLSEAVRLSQTRCEDQASQLKALRQELDEVCSQSAAREHQRQEQLEAARQYWEQEKEKLQLQLAQLQEQEAAERDLREQATRHAVQGRNDWVQLNRDLGVLHREQDQLVVRLDKLISATDSLFGTLFGSASDQ